MNGYAICAAGSSAGGLVTLKYIFTGMVPVDFLFVGERLAVDLLNTVIAQDGRVQDLLAKPGNVAAWAAAAGVVPAGAFSPSVVAREPNGLRRFVRRCGGGCSAGKHPAGPIGGWWACSTPISRATRRLRKRASREGA